jgi:hypothetical protein
MERIGKGLAVAALVSVGGCAALGARIGGHKLEAHVLARAAPEKLAAALSADLQALPADDPRRAAPQIVALRGLLEETDFAAHTVRFAAIEDAGIPATYALGPSPSPVTNTFADAPAPVELHPSFAVVLGRFDDAAIAAATWAELAAADPLAAKGLTPRLASAKGQAGQVTLVAGPLEDADTARGRCTAFAALGVACTAGAFEGKPLPRAPGA